MDTSDRSKSHDDQNAATALSHYELVVALEKLGYVDTLPVVASYDCGCAEGAEGAVVAVRVEDGRIVLMVA